MTVLHAFNVLPTAPIPCDGCLHFLLHLSPRELMGNRGFWQAAFDGEISDHAEEHIFKTVVEEGEGGR